MNVIFDFTFLYPFLMVYTWIFKSIIFRLFPKKLILEPPVFPENPSVSILIPCHNEEDYIEETITRLTYQNLPQFEIIAIDDASTDRTPEILKELQKTCQQLRVITLKTNQGKAMNMTMGAMVSRSEYILKIDADAILAPNALRWLLWHFKTSPRVGAVTGNPKARNRTSMLAKIQVVEFSSIIGIIKRTQRIFEKIYTASGVMVAFRKRALLNVGFWSNDIVTEDIDISWKLQLNSWDIRYEPKALCWILVPETLKGIFNQRLRWSQGMGGLLLKYYRCLFEWKNRRIWPLYYEYAINILWCYCFLLTLILYLVNIIIPLPQEYTIRSIMPGWSGGIMAITCIIQLSVALLFDLKYDKSLIKIFLWLIWYPAIYWIVNAILTIIAFQKAIFKRKEILPVRAPLDRGLKR